DRKTGTAGWTMPALSGHALSGGRENSRVPFPGNRFSVLSVSAIPKQGPQLEAGVMSPWKPETGSHAAGDPPSAGAVARYLAGHSIVTPIIIGGRADVAPIIMPIVAHAPARDPAPAVNPFVRIRRSRQQCSRQREARLQSPS